jgi:ubiquinone/menaquinone biosynthesis C-methylase UbiE
MKWIANLIMSRRANRLFRRIRAHLPSAGLIADIGSGTGHNAQAIRQQSDLSVTEFDVVDMHWVGPAPQFISADGKIPANDAACDGALLSFVLQYPADPLPILLEARRITHGPVLVLQSTYAGKLAYRALRLREFFFGRFGFYLARLANLVSEKECPLVPSHFFNGDALLELFETAGFEVRLQQSESSLLVKVRRDLFVLNRVERQEERQSDERGYLCHHSSAKRTAADQTNT